MSGGYFDTNSTRMEMLAIIKALESLKQPFRVTVYTDHKVTVDAMEGGKGEFWRKKGWRRGCGRRLAESDLWERLLVLCQKHDVSFRWVKGHSGVEENERCDRIAAKGAQASPSRSRPRLCTAAMRLAAPRHDTEQVRARICLGIVGLLRVARP